MGCCGSRPPGPQGDDEGPSQVLSFHPSTHGSRVLLDQTCHVAERVGTFHGGIVFTSRPVKRQERVTLKILKQEAIWHGGLRVGFTSMDPSRMDPAELPPYACPDLVLRRETWAAVVPDACVQQGAVLAFWVDHRGRVLFRQQSKAWSCLLLRGLPAQARLWAVIDVYGHTKAVQLLDPARPSAGVPGPSPALRTAHPTELHAPACRDCCSRLPGRAEPCIICVSHEARTRLQPCGHASFCHCCAQKVLGSSSRCPLCRRQIHSLGEAGPPADKEGSLSATSSGPRCCPARPCQRPACRQPGKNATKSPLQPAKKPPPPSRGTRPSRHTEACGAGVCPLPTGPAPPCSPAPPREGRHS